MKIPTPLTSSLKVSEKTKPLKGFVYLLTNASMPGLVKIGMTTYHPEKRVQELSSATGVPEKFHLEHYAFYPNAALAEKKLHKYFASNRKNHSREFFEVEIKKVISWMETEAHHQSQKTNKEDRKKILKEGFKYLWGKSGTLKSPSQALFYFEQLIPFDKAEGCYWSGLACQMESREQKSLQKQKLWDQKAIDFYLEALKLGRFKASAQLYRIFKKHKQYQAANKYWQNFLDNLTQKDVADSTIINWLVEYLNQTPSFALDIDHRVWKWTGPQIHQKIRKNKKYSRAQENYKFIQKRKKSKTWYKWFFPFLLCLVILGLFKFGILF